MPNNHIIINIIPILISTYIYRNNLYIYNTNRYKDKGVTVIVGLESRGYYFGIPLAWALKLPFVPFRKAGKLPGEVVNVEYGLEYGTYFNQNYNPHPHPRSRPRPYS